MKNAKETLSKLLNKVQEDKKATAKFVALIAIILVGVNYPWIMAIIGGCAIMVAIDQGAKGKDSLSFLKVPVDAVKIVSSDIKDSIAKKSSSVAQASEAEEAVKEDPKKEE